MYNGSDQRIQKTETAGSNPCDVVNYCYQDGVVLYTTGSDADCAFNTLGAASYYFYNKGLMGSTTNILGSDLDAVISYDYNWFGNTEVYRPETDFYNQICCIGGIYDESTQLCGSVVIILNHIESSQTKDNLQNEEILTK